ncbi:MAG TPA: tRNA (guanosine(37)-N1)-methyltransferase TrmD [Thermodesulfobacteriota bacterium]|nr:tRNA (guanosine(37)-N1)-methyltransferase TrmD [Thermodesulfobacteriota bacterium]
MTLSRVMIVDILTLFPGFFLSPLQESILSRGIEEGRIRIRIFNLRDFATDRHRTVDDRPYGGGAGMILRPEPLKRALIWLSGLAEPSPRVILLTPQGTPLNQTKVKALAAYQRILLICGRYEGVDERIADFYCNDQISIGDYVLSGGEPAALVVLDALGRLVPEVMGCAESSKEESFEGGLLEYPQYTRPRQFDGHEVPPILFSGDHKKIQHWRHRQALIKTVRRRPDLIAESRLDAEDQAILRDLEGQDQGKE